MGYGGLLLDTILAFIHSTTFETALTGYPCFYAKNVRGTVTMKVYKIMKLFTKLL